jgi:3'(2'), 5'-bisphosphate nucleotidase
MALLKAPLIKERKADKSLVTNADRAADDILRNGLRRAFPEHAVLTEETILQGAAGAEFLWLVDPLDGTRAYAKRIPGFSVMLGLIHEGRPVLGVVYDPLENRLYEAVRGRGAFQTLGGVRSPLRVSSRAKAAEWPVIVSTGFPDALKQRLSAGLAGPWLPPINSVGIKVGFMARGEADVYVNHHPVHFWDTAGPQAILEEAGGKITLWDGHPLAYGLAKGSAHPGPTLATHGVAHEDVLRLLP